VSRFVQGIGGNPDPSFGWRNKGRPFGYHCNGAGGYGQKLGTIMFMKWASTSTLEVQHIGNHPARRVPLRGHEHIWMNLHQRRPCCRLKAIL
jgi:hypothetical protein